MKYSLTISLSARGDMKEIYSYISFFNLHSAKTITKNIVKQIRLLTTFPELGKKINNKSFFADFEARYLIMNNYIVYYSINNLTRTIEIIRVLNQTTNWRQILTVERFRLLDKVKKTKNG